MSELQAALPAALQEVRGRIAAAASRAGRALDAVRLIAISKGQPAEKIRAAYEAGQRDFGENYAQELKAKSLELSGLGELRWHFVGHLQSNKAKLVAPVVQLIHSVDSENLARELVKRAPAQRLRGLIEVNLASEPQKGGVAIADVLPLAQALSQVTGFELAGLMCVPPAEAPARPAFVKLRELRDATAAALRRPLPELSMGMSSDFEEAVEEGATLVRVGTAIFGARS